jgi:hypothetical protein
MSPVGGAALESIPLRKLNERMRQDVTRVCTIKCALLFHARIVRCVDKPADVALEPAALRRGHCGSPRNEGLAAAKEQVAMMQLVRSEAADERAP